MTLREPSLRAPPVLFGPRQSPICHCERALSATSPHSPGRGNLSLSNAERDCFAKVRLLMTRVSFHQEVRLGAVGLLAMTLRRGDFSTQSVLFGQPVLSGLPASSSSKRDVVFMTPYSAAGPPMPVAVILQTVPAGGRAYSSRSVVALRARSGINPTAKKLRRMNPALKPKQRSVLPNNVLCCRTTFCVVEQRSVLSFPGRVQRAKAYATRRSLDHRA